MANLVKQGINPCQLMEMEYNRIKIQIQSKTILRQIILDQALCSM